MYKCILPTIVFVFVSILVVVGIIYVVVVDKYKDDTYSSNQNREVDSDILPNSISSTTIGYITDNYSSTSKEELDSSVQEQNTIDTTLIDASKDESEDSSGYGTEDWFNIDNNWPKANSKVDIPIQASTTINPIMIGGSGDRSADGSGDNGDDDDESSGSFISSARGRTIPTVEPANTSLIIERTNQTTVKVTFYYETLCPYCQNWIEKQLCPVVEKLSEYFYIDFVPYGNAKKEHNKKTGKVIISCQHDSEECEGNRIQSCALKQLSYLQSTRLICCMESENNFDPQGKRCLEKLSIDVPSIINCANGLDGQYYHYLNGLKTEKLNPTHQGVPWIIFNDKYKDAAEMSAARNNFISVLCKYIPVPKPAECKLDDYSYDYDFDDA